MHRRLALLAAGAPSLLAGAIAAQEARPPEAADLFRQVIPNPTGKNGYEDLVLAAQLYSRSRHKPAVDQGRLTLTERRRVLADASLRRVQQLIRQGISRPVTSPREKLDFTTLLPEFAHFRSLARLLMIEQYVLLADGRIPDAIQASRVFLRFAQVIQTDTLISGLVGIAISSMGIRGLGDHLDQLSFRDCDLLYRTCLEWLAQPTALPRMIETEQRAGREFLATMAQQFRARGLGFLKDMGLDSPDAASQDLLRRAQADPLFLDNLARDSARRLDRFYDDLRVELRKPLWEQKLPEVGEDGSFAATLARQFLPAFTSVVHRYGEAAARVRILGCHAAIRRYRWETQSPPATLAGLRLGDLAIDPFNGAPLQYEVRGTRYRLSSVGSPAKEDDPQAVNGRRPVTVGPDF